MILPMFRRTKRLGVWQIHKSAFLAMLSWFAHYDHTNCMRRGTVYSTYVNLLEISHPDLYRQFLDGNFIIKSTHQTFNQISTDLALEQGNKVEKWQVV